MFHKINNLLEKDLSYKLRGIFMEISQQYGYKFKESIYHNICCEKFSQSGVRFQSKPKLSLFSLDSSKKIGYFIPDFIIEEKLIVEIKNTKDYSRCKY